MLAVSGAGIVCSTMLLTNAAGNLLNSLPSLELNDKPNIEELEVEPVVEQKEEKPSPEASDSSDSDSSDSTDSSDSQASKQGAQGAQNAQSEASASASTTSSNGNLKPEDAIRVYVTRIVNPQYLLDIGSLTKNHNIISTLGELTSALSALEAAASGSST